MLTQEIKCGADTGITCSADTGDYMWRLNGGLKQDIT